MIIKLQEILIHGQITQVQITNMCTVSPLYMENQQLMLQQKIYR